MKWAFTLFLFSFFCRFSFAQNSDNQSDVDAKEVELLLNNKEKKYKFIDGGFYFSWGYNWTVFTKTDITFDMPEGKYIVHDVVGVDRPSTNIVTYFTDLTIPQYNVRFGYKLPLKNGKTTVGLGIAMDHMKWVVPFYAGQKYTVTGDYNREVYVLENNVVAGYKKVDFDYVKQTGDMTYIQMYEHTNGYNYAHLKLCADQALFINKRGTIKIVGHLDVGMGLIIPKTEFHQQVDVGGIMVTEGKDNVFNVAGWGLNVGVGIGLKFQPKKSRVGVELSTQQEFGFSKIEHALLDGSGRGVGSDSGIGWLQLQPLMLTINVDLRRAIPKKDKVLK